MKAINIILSILKWIIILGILFFSLATFMGKSYGQTLLLVLIALTIAYWPSVISKKWNKKISMFSRLSLIAILFVIIFVFIGGEPKTSIYITQEHQQNLMRIYDKKVTDWPDDTRDIYIETPYGNVHVLACGDTANPPLMMVHAASMGAHSWAENLEPLLDHYRIFSIDNIGEGNKSQLKNALEFPQNSKEIADLYVLISDSLGVQSAPWFGASNGGFISMSFAYYYPERVESLALFGPMGLTQLSGKSIMMLSLCSMYPFQSIRDYTTRWALGTDVYCNAKYGDWFNCIMQGTIPSVAQPVPMTTKQKQNMDLPVLLFLGTKDAIVGDAEFARQTAMDFPNIQIEVLESGHLIAVEHADFVNEKVREFLFEY